MSKIIFTDDQIVEIIDMYLNQHLSTKKIGNKFNVSWATIYRLLQKNNIKCDSNSVKRKYKLDESYFDNINSPNKAYILGLLYADGNNSFEKSTIRIQLQDVDKEILEKINIEIGYNKPLKFVEQSKRKYKNYNYSYCDMWCLDIYSSHMCKTLAQKGMVPNKSLILEFPTWLDQDLYSHFLRGYFDGDGSLCYRTLKNGEMRSIVTFTSTNDFCLLAQRVINAKVGLNGGIYDSSSHNGITKVLSYSGSKQVELLLKWLYEDADLYMKRKYDKFINFLNIIQNKSLSA